MPSRSKYWCWTLNNPTSEEEISLASYADDAFRDAKKVVYLVAGREVGESGTRHFQGYVELSFRARLTQLKQLPGLARGHFEIRRGSADQAIEYCLKDNDVLVRAGEPTLSGQGSRTDLEQLKQAIKDGKRAREIADEHFKEFLKYQRGINAARIAYSEKRTWQPSVVVYWGRTGAGKTRAVFDNLSSPEDIYVHPGGSWFDGYEGQPIVLFDDYGGSEFKLQYLLKLLDRYPMQVPVKGGFTSFIPREIYITSNLDPKDWYRHAHQEHVDAMFRRFSFTYHWE